MTHRVLCPRINHERLFLMKSMLHEGSTVVKAIQKAWEASGMPLEFTIHVHEVGETNFLGFSKHPAIVSIAYDPKKVQVSSHQAHKGAQRNQGQHGQRSDLRNNQQGQQKAYAKPKFESKPNKVYPDKERPVPQNAPKPVAPAREHIKPEAFQAPEQEQWTQEMVNDVREWLKELLAHVGIATPFSMHHDFRMLTVTFESNVMPTPEEERQLFIGLSYTLMQFLKKKCKKKLRGHHLVFNSKHSNSSQPAA